MGMRGGQRRKRSKERRELGDIERYKIISPQSLNPPISRKPTKGNGGFGRLKKLSFAPT